MNVSRTRCAPRALLVGLGVVGLLAFVALGAAQKANISASGSGPAKPWFDTRLRAFFTAKAQQAHHLTEQQKKPIDTDVWRYFEAGMSGDWRTVTNLWFALRKRSEPSSFKNNFLQPPSEYTKADERIRTIVWPTIVETYLAWEQFSNGKEKYVLAFGNDIIKSIPPGSIYLGGTDPGRGVITAMSESHAEAKPFFTISQNALTDGAYLNYLRAMYGPAINTPTAEDSQKCFNDYVQDASRRLDHDQKFPNEPRQIKPGEDVRIQDGKVQVSGQMAVIGIRGPLSKIIFDRNPDREFYVEESFPLDWMYPHLSPNGLIMKMNRQPLPELSEEVVLQDHEYWSRYLQPIVGDWLAFDTSVAEVVRFAEKVYLQHQLGSFTGDPEFVRDASAQKAFSKLRSSIGGLYIWRMMTSEKASPQHERMIKEADFAFRQAFVLCPTSAEALFRYVNLLLSPEVHRVDDALLLAETTLKLDPQNGAVKNLVQQLKRWITEASSKPKK